MPEEELEVVAPEATEETAETETETESVEDLKARLQKAEELANNYKIRSEKAEKKAKEAPAHDAKEPSFKDAMYLAKADIHTDDVDEVLETARARNWSVKQAHEYLTPILETRAEHRKTAGSANKSNNVGRSPAKASDEVLISRASKGDLPDIGDDEAINRLIAAKMRQK